MLWVGRLETRKAGRCSVKLDVCDVDADWIREVAGWTVKACPAPARQAARATCEIRGMVVVYCVARSVDP